MIRKNNIYQQILDYYSKKQDENLAIRDEKKERLYKEIPLLRQIEKQELEYTIKTAKEIAKGKSPNYKDKLEELEEAKKAQLVNYGYPLDYLEIKYECEKCKDTGFINRKPCTCFSQRLAKVYYKMSNLDKILEKENFQTFDFNVFSEEKNSEGLSQRQNMEEIMKAASRFIRKFQDPEEYNLLFYGNTGLGKTFMINCISKEILDLGFTVIYQTAHNLMETIEEYKFEKTDSILEAKKKYDYLLEADLLIIDDLGTEVPNSFTTSEIFNILNSRNLNNKKMLISTNLTPAEISDIYTDRVYSRILETFDTYEFIGNDLRWKGY